MGFVRSKVYFSIAHYQGSQVLVKTITETLYHVAKQHTHHKKLTKFVYMAAMDVEQNRIEMSGYYRNSWASFNA